MIPILSIVGKSNSGKTTLIEKIIPHFKKAGFSVGILKHVSHEFNLDKYGKDSYKHKEAGAKTVMLMSKKKMAIIKDIDNESLEDKLNYFKNSDILITEGFKKKRFPKIEVFRPELHKKLACINDPSLLAIVSSIKLKNVIDIPQFHIDDIFTISKFIENKILQSNLLDLRNNMKSIF